MDLNTNDPDFHIEEFWYGFKQSMINFYISIGQPYDMITTLSFQLNELKRQKKYDEIELNIRESITSYSFDLAKYTKSFYYDEILLTNIKRWNKISKQFNFNQSKKHNKIFLIFLIYFEFKKDANAQDFLSKLKPIEELIKTDDFNEIIIFAVKNEKTKILDLLKEMPNYNIFLELNKIYPVISPKAKKIKMLKIVQIIKKEK
jgi:hypothetical protein